MKDVLPHCYYLLSFLFLRCCPCTPALQLPDGKGRRREVKTRQAEPGGDGGVRGSWDFSSRKPGWNLFDTINFTWGYWPPGRFVQWNIHWQLISLWRRKCQGRDEMFIWAWLKRRQYLGWDKASMNSLSLFKPLWSFSLMISSVLDKEPLGLKVLAKSRIKIVQI